MPRYLISWSDITTYHTILDARDATHAIKRLQDIMHTDGRPPTMEPVNDDWDINWVHDLPEEEPTTPYDAT